MTHVQIYTGGQPIDPEAIKAAGVRTMFNADITDWNEPPVPPSVDASMRAADMPPSIRKMLADALIVMIEKATGFKVSIH